MTLDEQVELIRSRMSKHRFDQWKPHHVDWKEDVRHIPGCKKAKAGDIIREHLLAGHMVTAGWYSTSIRGYHDYRILWKERAK